MNAPVNITPQHWQDLTALGFSVFPVRRGGKEPLGKWKEYQTKAPDPAKVGRWADSQVNIGIACGAVSGLVVLDLDTPEAIAEAKRRGIPDTITAQTGKGLHVYFRHPGGKIGNRAGIFPGADIRGDGGYIVAPPSLHPSGARYWWSNPPGLFDLAPMPAWLVDMLAAPKAKAEAQEPAPSRPIASHGGDHPYCVAALDSECEAIRKAPNGQQEATLNRAALKMGHYVGGAVLTHQTAKNRLLSAALAMPSHDARRPWTQSELIMKIEHGLADGAREPKGVPERVTQADFDSFDPQTGEIIDRYPEPVDLWNQFDPPELPHGILPPIIEKFARINAEHMGADPAAFAMAALTVCAAAIPDAIKLKARRHSDYLESARIWTVLVGEPSTKKTPSMARAKAPLERLNFKLIAENNRKLAEWQKDKKDGSDTPKPPRPRLILNDATTEAAQEALKDSPNGMLLFQDELSGFFGRIEKYGGGAKAGSADRGFWLQAYNGGAYAVDRVSRGAFVIENLSVCLLGGIQFEPIRRVANEAVDDGLIQRINPILLRRPTLGKDAPQPAINDDYDALIEKLTQAQTASEFWLDAPITLDDDALAICREIEEFKMGLTDIERTNPKLATHLGKYEGLFVRYCLLFHCIENIDAPGGVPMVVTGELAERVRKFLFEYLMKHARAFYVELIGMAEGHDELEKLAGYILTKRLDKVTVRELARSTGGKAALTALEAQTLAEKLESLGWLERAENNRVGALVFKVNPRVHAKFEAKAKAEAERRKRAREIMTSLASA